MSSTHNDPVRTEERDGVLVITIDRPEVRNAIDAVTAEAIGTALERFDVDGSLSVAVITGAGGGFSSGMDLDAFGRGAKPSYADRGFAGMTRRTANKPLIAAVEGFAVAGGFEMAIACDLIVASRGARFALPEVRRGLVAAAGALLRLPRRMPYHLVMELALTGDFIDAERLYSLGVVNRLVEPDTALDVAIELARHIMVGAPLAIAATKHILTEQQDWTLANMWDRQDVYFRAAVETEDAHEGAAAFKERREPVWKRR
jgi:enoyl-CoA hydratase